MATVEQSQKMEVKLLGWVFRNIPNNRWWWAGEEGGGSSSGEHPSNRLPQPAEVKVVMRGGGLHNGISKGAWPVQRTMWWKGRSSPTELSLRLHEHHEQRARRTTAVCGIIMRCFNTLDHRQETIGFNGRSVSTIRITNHPVLSTIRPHVYLTRCLGHSVGHTWALSGKRLTPRSLYY